MSSMAMESEADSASSSSSVVSLSEMPLSALRGDFPTDLLACPDCPVGVFFLSDAAFIRHLGQHYLDMAEEAEEAAKTEAADDPKEARPGGVRPCPKSRKAEEAARMEEERRHRRDKKHRRHRDSHRDHRNRDREIRRHGHRHRESGGSRKRRASAPKEEEQDDDAPLRKKASSSSHKTTKASSSSSSSSALFHEGTYYYPCDACGTYFFSSREQAAHLCKAAADAARIGRGGGGGKADKEDKAASSVVDLNVGIGEKVKMRSRRARNFFCY